MSHSQKTLLVTQQSTSPCGLTCDLWGENGGNDIYVGDSTYVLYFTITNKSQDTFTLNPISGQASSSNAHFQLYFSQGRVLTLTSDYPATAAPDWALTATGSGSPETVQDIYLAYTGTLPYELPPGGTLVIPIEYQSSTTADAETCHITVTPLGGSTLWSPDPSCTTGIQIVEDVTTFTFELVAEIVGSNAILNDGLTANAVTLRLLNPTASPIILEAGVKVFQISIDTASATTDNAAPTVLCTPDQAAVIHIGAPNSNFQPPTSIAGDNVLRQIWTVDTVSSPSAEPINIPAGGGLDFPITNIVTAMPPGMTTIYVQCVNVPTVAGQVLVAQLEKTPAYFPQATGTTQNGSAINAGALLYAPATLTDGGSALLIEGAVNSASLTLLTLNAPSNSKYTGLVINGISGDQYGANITVNSTHAAINTTQTGTGSNIVVNGGGVVVNGITGGYNGLSVNTTGTAAGIQVNQTGTGSAISTNGGNGLYVYGIAGTNSGLSIQSNGTGAAIHVTQSGTGGTGAFDGGSGLNVYNIAGGNNGLNISSASTAAAIQVTQTGTGGAASFSGGAGLNVYNITGGNNGLNISASSSAAAVQVAQAGTGKAATFSGDVEIDGNLTVKGQINLQTDPSSNTYEVILQSGNDGGATLKVMTNAYGTANVSVWNAYIYSTSYWYDSSGTSSGHISYNSSSGLTISQDEGPDGVIDTQ